MVHETPPPNSYYSLSTRPSWVLTPPFDAAGKSHRSPREGGIDCNSLYRGASFPPPPFFVHSLAPNPLGFSIRRATPIMFLGATDLHVTFISPPAASLGYNRLLSIRFFPKPPPPLHEGTDSKILPPPPPPFWPFDFLYTARWCSAFPSPSVLTAEPPRPRRRLVTKPPVHLWTRWTLVTAAQHLYPFFFFSSQVRVRIPLGYLHTP